MNHHESTSSATKLSGAEMSRAEMSRAEEINHVAKRYAPDLSKSLGLSKDRVSDLREGALRVVTKFAIARARYQNRIAQLIVDERGDVPGWVLVVLMTTGLVTGIWAVAAPRIESLLRGSLDAMNNVH